MAANDYQVGGDHYKQPPGVPQHWDLSIMYQWDGFQHCITKYLMRWKTKYPSKEKKLEDLKKAAHMLQKYIENYEAFLPTEQPKKDAPLLMSDGALLFAEYEQGYSRYMSSNQFRHEGGWGDGTNLYTCLVCGEKVKATSLERAEQAHQCPAPGGQGLGAPAHAGGAATAAPAPAAGPPTPAAGPSAPLGSTFAGIAPDLHRLAETPKLPEEPTL